MARIVRGDLSKKILDHSIINDVGPKIAIFKGFSTLSNFWRKSSLRMFIFEGLNENSDFPWNPRENRMSGKILGDF